MLSLNGVRMRVLLWIDGWVLIKAAAKYSNGNLACISSLNLHNHMGTELYVVKADLFIFVSSFHDSVSHWVKINFKTI